MVGGRRIVAEHNLLCAIDGVYRECVERECDMSSIVRCPSPYDGVVCIRASLRFTVGLARLDKQRAHKYTATHELAYIYT